MFVAVDIKWVGLRPSQAASLGLPSPSLKVLTRKDIAVAESLLRTSFIQVDTTRSTSTTHDDSAYRYMNCLTCLL